MSSDNNHGVLLLLQNVSKTYALGGSMLPAVEDTSLTILPGEYVSISGLFGASKKAFFNCIGCLTKPSSGKYFLDYTDTGMLNDAELVRLRNEKVGFVLKPDDLIPEATVADHMMLPVKYSMPSNANTYGIIENTIHLFKLQDVKTQTIRELSELDKMKLTLAMAMVKSPLVLIMDEPTENMNESTSMEILNIIREVNDQGKAVIIFTDKTETANAARRNIIFENSKVHSDISKS